MRWTGHAACIGETRNAYRGLEGKPGKGDIFEDLRVDGSIILKLILKKQEESNEA
jgi:hypothetical protein